MQSVVDLVLLATLWATAISIGAQTSLELGSRHGAWYARAILLNVVGAPLLAALLAFVFDLPPEARAALVLVGAAAGGALGLATSRLGGGDVSRSLVLILVLELGNLVLIPLWTTLLLSSWVPVPIMDVAGTLLLALGLPLAIGFVVRRRATRWAAAVARVAAVLASVGLLVVIGLLVVLDLGPLLDSGRSLAVALAGSLFITIVLLAGALLGGPGADGRTALATVSAARSSALALVIARDVYADRQEVVAAVVVIGLIGVLLPVASTALARAVLRRSPVSAGSTAGLAPGPSGADPAS
jgi:BASS family bile acid:Na+ symporter